jgi:hypothetical protein
MAMENNKIEQLTTQVEQIRERLEQAKGTGAEATFRQVLTQLEFQLEAAIKAQEVETQTLSPVPPVTLVPQKPQGLTDQELIDKLELSIKAPTLLNWRTEKTTPRGKNKAIYDDILASYQFQDNLWFLNSALQEQTSQSMDDTGSVIADSEESVDDGDVDVTVFQAIAWIKGEVVQTKDEEGKFIKKLIYKGKEYDCRFLTKQQGGAVSDIRVFGQFVANKGEMILAVYPRWTHFPGRDNPPSFKFEIFGWGNVPPNKEVDKFYIRGIWQFIAVYPRPVITVYRNRKRYDDDRLKADHCPVFWKDSPVKPFRFNPKAEKDQQGDRYFVECVCEFNPRFDSLNLIELLSEPTTNIPRYKKPVKAVPARDTGKGKGKSKEKEN